MPSGVDGKSSTLLESVLEGSGLASGELTAFVVCDDISMLSIMEASVELVVATSDVARSGVCVEVVVVSEEGATVLSSGLNEL